MIQNSDLKLRIKSLQIVIFKNFYKNSNLVLLFSSLFVNDITQMQSQSIDRNTDFPERNSQGYQ